MSAAEIIRLPTGDTDAAVNFLRCWHAEVPITLIGIDPNSNVIKRGDYALGDDDRLRGVIESHQGRLNLYTQVNVCAPGLKKPSKVDMVAARAFHIDADLKDLGASPEEAFERARAFDPAPTVIVNSGNGLWLLWKLDRPYAEGDDWQARVESICKAMAEQMGAGAGCHNIDRLMRVPGTINLPDATKRARGNVPVLARVVEANWQRTWSFARDLVPRLPHPALVQSTTGRTTARDSSRSGVAFRKWLALRRTGTARRYDEMCAVLGADPETADWVLEKGRSHAERELKRIWGKVERIVTEPPYEIITSAPLETARLFRDLRYDANDQPTLYHHRGEFYSWNGAAYPEIEANEVRALVYRFLDQCVVSSKDDDGNWKAVPVRPNTNLVNNVLDALRAEALLPAAVAPPAWLDGRFDPVAADVIACANGLLHLPTGRLLPHEPAFFTHNALDFAYEPGAPAPAGWLGFLGQLWGDDEESIATLQEVFGYCLGADTSLQKAFLLVGPKRSGKGTIARVLTAVIGAENTVAPTLASLGANFGLAPLIGKRVAIVSDARLSGRTDQAVVAERLLSITGEDGITVDRKFKDAWTGRLTARFLVLSNELPKLNDASGALASRFVVMVLRKSFFGREDPGLTARLLNELPGILNWAIEGWRRLRERGYFVQPAAASQAVEELEDLGSPIGAFLRDRCVVATGASVTADKLFVEWEAWCLEQRRDHPGDKATFGRNLHAALPGVERKQRRKKDGEGTERYYDGVRLKTPEEQMELNDKEAEQYRLSIPDYDDDAPPF